MMENTTTTTEQMAATESVEGAETQNGATETQDEPSPAAVSDGNANGPENGTEEEEEEASKTKTVDGILAKVQCVPQILCFSLYIDLGV